MRDRETWSKKRRGNDISETEHAFYPGKWQFPVFGSSPRFIGIEQRMLVKKLADSGKMEGVEIKISYRWGQRGSQLICILGEVRGNSGNRMLQCGHEFVRQGGMNSVILELAFAEFKPDTL